MIDVASLASAVPGRGPDPSADEATQLKFTFARMLVGEVRKAMPQGEAFKALDGLGPVLDDALATQIAGQLDLDLGRHPAPIRSPAAPRVAAPRVTSPFGVRHDPITGGLRHHRGLDLAAPRGTPVRAAQAGTVIFAGDRGGYGRVVIVDHGDGLTTRYAHCDELRAAVGERVEAGAVVGEVGSTGRSTGPHLHFEVRKDGVAIDPEAWAEVVIGPPPG